MFWSTLPLKSVVKHLFINYTAWQGPLCFVWCPLQLIRAERVMLSLRWQLIGVSSLRHWLTMHALLSQKKGTQNGVIIHFSATNTVLTWQFSMTPMRTFFRGHLHNQRAASLIGSKSVQIHQSYALCLLGFSKTTLFITSQGVALMLTGLGFFGCLEF